MSKKVYTGNSKPKKVSSICPIHNPIEKTIIGRVCKSCNKFNDIKVNYQNDFDKQSRSNESDEYTYQKCMVHGKIMGKNKEVNSIKSQNLASGDHKSNEIQETYRDKNKKEIAIVYKNENYQDKELSTDSSMMRLIKDRHSNESKTVNKNQTYALAPRPVICPVSNCAKMVTIDSMMSHFYFDHSKVPRNCLTLAEPVDFFIKTPYITSETQCLAIFSRILHKRASLTSYRSSQSLNFNFISNNINKDTKLLLLMAVRIQTAPANFCRSGISINPLKTTAKKSASTQTHNHSEPSYVNITKNKKLSTSNMEANFHSNKTTDYDNDEMILMWLCKLDEEERTYTIILSRNDQKLSYGFTGDAIPIKDKQDPSSIYERPECLMIRGKAINRLLDNDKQVRVIVNFVN